VADGEAGEGQQVLGVVAQHALELGELSAQHPGDHVQLFVDVAGIRLGEDGANGGGDHLGGALGDLGEHVAEEVDPAALHRGAGHHRGHGLAQAEVGVGDDQLHPAQPACLQAAQELGPEGAVLAVPDGEAEDLTAAITAHPGGHDHGLGDDAAVDSCFAVGGVHEHIGKLWPARERSRKAATSLSRSAQMRLTSLLLMPLSAPRARTRSSTFLVETPWR
jgi:hypothetical protein